MPLLPEEFAAMANVSRETLASLAAYATLLAKWQKSINLVATGSLAEVWCRHMLDSAQLHPLLPSGTRSLVDFGSGAGFPGLVLAIMGVPEVHLIESDARKCVFLAEAARIAGLQPDVNPIIHHARIEGLRPWRVDVVTARACAELRGLLGYAAPFLDTKSICLFLKGARVEDELTKVAKEWRMTADRIPSISDSSGIILRLGQVTRAGQPA